MIYNILYYIIILYYNIYINYDICIYLAPPFGLKLKPFPKRILLDPRAEN